VASHQQIEVGARVEMSIEWPVLLDGRISLQLFGVGHVLRREAGYFAASFERYEFRTLKRESRLQTRHPAGAPRIGVVQYTAPGSSNVSLASRFVKHPPSLFRPHLVN
jgi:hypothetical protein